MSVHWNPGCSPGMLPWGSTVLLCKLDLGILGWTAFLKMILRFLHASVLSAWLLYGGEVFSFHSCILLTTTLRAPRVPCAPSLGELTGSGPYGW